MNNKSNITSNLKCSACGQSLKDSTLLSETFSYDGGCMVFKCECGNETRRDFIPLDTLDQEQQIKVLLSNTDLDKETQQVALLHYKKYQSIKKLEAL